MHWGSVRSNTFYFYALSADDSICKSLDQTKLPLGLKSGEVGSPLDTFALLSCCCSCRILGATGAAAEFGCEWMSATTAERGCPPLYPYKSPGGAAEEGGTPHRLSGLP